MKLSGFLLTIFIAVLVFTTQFYAQGEEIEATLGGNTNEHGFSVKDNEDNTLFRVNGKGEVGINGTLKVGISGLSISEIVELNGNLENYYVTLVDLPGGWTIDNTRILSLEIYRVIPGATTGVWTNESLSSYYKYTYEIQQVDVLHRIMIRHPPNRPENLFRIVLMKVNSQ